MRNNLLILSLTILYSCIHHEEKIINTEIKTELIKNISNKKKNKEQNKHRTIEMKNFLMGKFKVNQHNNFVLVDKKYHNKEEMYLQKETLDAFIRMNKLAKEEGIHLKIVSGTRDFYSQRAIWERKYNLNKSNGLSNIENIKTIMAWSAMPATSRHHWGTEIDINGFEEYFNGKNERSNKEYKWLKSNAHKFGFCQVYTKKKKEKRYSGYNEEKWHWSYMPLSSYYLEKYKELITYTDINGFTGHDLVKELDIIKRFVLTIENECNSVL